VVKLTEADRRAIADAVAEAERGTAGEIYCIVAGASADYGRFRWRGRRWRPWSHR
jgi:uncharacterized membrane protein